MITDIVNEVAGELCVSATNIVPELTKLKIMQYAFWCCVCAVIALICLFIFIKQIKNEEENKQLKFLCDELGVSKSEVIRELIADSSYELYYGYKRGKKND